MYDRPFLADEIVVPERSEILYDTRFLQLRKPKRRIPIVRLILIAVGIIMIIASSNAVNEVLSNLGFAERGGNNGSVIGLFIGFSILLIVGILQVVNGEWSSAMIYVVKDAEERILELSVLNDAMRKCLLRSEDEKRQLLELAANLGAAPQQQLMSKLNQARMMRVYDVLGPAIGYGQIISLSCDCGFAKELNIGLFSLTRNAQLIMSYNEYENDIVSIWSNEASDKKLRVVENPFELRTPDTDKAAAAPDVVECPACRKTSLILTLKGEYIT